MQNKIHLHRKMKVRQLNQDVSIIGKLFNAGRSLMSRSLEERLLRSKSNRIYLQSFPDIKLLKSPLGCEQVGIFLSFFFGKTKYLGTAGYGVGTARVHTNKNYAILGFFVLIFFLLSPK